MSFYSISSITHTTRQRIPVLYAILFFLLFAVQVDAASTSSISIDTMNNEESDKFSLNLNIPASNETTEIDLLTTELAHIPSSEEVNPPTADEVHPSAELKDIIKQIKNGTMLEITSKSSSKKNYSIDKEGLEIIKKGAEVKQATEVRPSPALEAVLNAYRNGSLNYARRDISDMEDELFYHQPYAEIDLASIYDLVVLQTGRDIFLSLDYHDLRHNKISAEEMASSRIKDLEQTIAAIKIKESNKQNKELDQIVEQRNKPQVKISIIPKQTFARKVLNLLGIRRKNDIVDYEQLSVNFRAYKSWSKHIEDVDEMLRRKRKRKIQLIHQRRYRPSRQLGCGDPAYRGACPEGQLEINPYKKGNIRFIKP
ncbi:hypothetical protein [Maridesulfovibrio sp.]|uniref:hypothetical protein n=1 Tax=Maridesulfovibrio sp. TaxID=2795000 RepID=UPI0039EEFD67